MFQESKNLLKMQMSVFQNVPHFGIKKINQKQKMTTSTTELKTKQDISVNN